MRKNLIWAAITFFLIIFFDRFTKNLALNGGLSKFYLKFINFVINFDLTINRGIALGFLNSQNNYIFFAIFLLIILIIFYLINFTKNKIKSNSFVIGEILILSGAFSNIYDRIFYNGVIDFIALSFSKFNITIFNMADIFIVIGAIIMFVNNFD